MAAQNDEQGVLYVPGHSGKDSQVQRSDLPRISWLSVGTAEPKGRLPAHTEPCWLPGKWLDLFQSTQSCFPGLLPCIDPHSTWPASATAYDSLLPTPTHSHLLLLHTQFPLPATLSSMSLAVQRALLLHSQLSMTSRRRSP